MEVASAIAGSVIVLSVTLLLCAKKKTEDINGFMHTTAADFSKQATPLFSLFLFFFPLFFLFRFLDF